MLLDDEERENIEEGRIRCTGLTDSRGRHDEVWCSSRQPRTDKAKGKSEAKETRCVTTQLTCSPTVEIQLGRNNIAFVPDKYMYDEESKDANTLQCPIPLPKGNSQRPAHVFDSVAHTLCFLYNTTRSHIGSKLSMNPGSTFGRRFRRSLECRCR